MKHVLVLGAGLVAAPLVRRLLEDTDLSVVVASRTLAKAQGLVQGLPRGVARELDARDADSLAELIRSTDVCVSLLPHSMHPLVAEVCLHERRHFVTTSYVSDAMRGMDRSAKEAGLTFLNEVGLDPGIDHMSAMRIIDRVHASGGKVTLFHSYCGGLPAPESNTNPWGYKFSWSPRGVVLAGRNSARRIVDGRTVETPGHRLFREHWLVAVRGFGELEAYPNRDALPYVETYGLNGVEDMMRATLRYPGWSFTMQKLADIGFFDIEERNIGGMTYADLTRQLCHIDQGTDLHDALAESLDVDESSDTLLRLRWLGLTSAIDVPTESGGMVSPLDALAARMSSKLVYTASDRDICLMQHEIEAKHNTGQRSRIVSTLVARGDVDGDTAMARTVGLPAAVATEMILRGQIGDRGVLIPVLPTVYEPILGELEASAGIVFAEVSEPIA